jgi:general secretion pathway protein G
MRKGFTLIELLVVMSIIALLLTLVSPRYFQSIDNAKEKVLRENLHIVRDAIDKYYSDNGKYPVTESSSTWLLLRPADPAKGALFNIRSGAVGNTRDGIPYGEM